MQLIDDEGDLFGLLNVVDALAILLVIAVVAAGSAFVLADEPEQASEPNTETRYATLDLGTQPSYVAELLSEGDTTALSETDELSITDVYAIESNSTDQQRVFVRVGLVGEPTDDGSITYDGDLPRVGRGLSIVTDDYQTTGTITAVGEENPELPIVDTPVLLRATVATDTAEAIEPGDEYEVDGRTVGTVESVAAYGTDDPERKRVYVGVTYRALRLSDDLHVGGTRLHENAPLSFETDAYDFDGTVARVGATEQRGESATRTVRLEMENVDPALADSLDAGMTERVRGETVAELTRVNVEPAAVVVTGEDGQIYQREHPVEKDVSMTARLAVQESSTGITFKGERLRQGEETVLDLGTVTVRVTVVQVE
ncbi:DUF4330 family protein [Haloprofundus halophilus]|uniref:DUF4330 family protein n=1 Tax=Haloprofundus halophilus TaxID=2283527 RepID=UPI000E43281D|nr:DUF4330 family protein [Haloprofundus halophilus]